MSIWGCSSPAHYCQPAVAAGFVYAALRSELNSHLAPTGFVYLEFSWVWPPLLQAFPFPGTLGEVVLHLPSPAVVFTVHMGSDTPPHRVEFSSHCHFYKLSRSWLLGVCWRSCLLQLACCEGFPSPPLGAQGTPPSLLLVFFIVIQFVFFLFSLGGGWSVQGGYAELAQGCLWEYCVPLSSPGGLLLPGQWGAGVWQHESPPRFSI
jgi:hypothetical protein